MSKATCLRCRKVFTAAHRRYPLDPLGDLLRMSVHQACAFLGVAGTTYREYRCHGVTRTVADRLANRAGEHPYSLWPEMIDHDIEDASVPCAECRGPFVPSRPGHIYCSRRCRHRVAQRNWKRRRYQNDPDYAAEQREKARRLYEETRSYRLKWQARYARERGEAEIRRTRYHSDPEYRARRVASAARWRAKQKEKTS